MKIEYSGNKELRINYRFPWEFVFCSWRLRKAIRIWLYYYWTDWMRDLWIDKGFRFFGIEFMKRIYGSFPNPKTIKQENINEIN